MANTEGPDQNAPDQFDLGIHYLLSHVCPNILGILYKMIYAFSPYLPYQCTYTQTYSKTCVKRPHTKRPKIGFHDQLSLNAGQKYCRMLQVEHSAILLIFIKLPFVIKIFVLSIFEWPFYTGFTVIAYIKHTDMFCCFFLRRYGMDEYFR